MDQVMTEVRKIPPVTRFFILSSLGITLPTIMNLFSAGYFVPTLVFSKFQIWRLYTSMFLGGRGIPYIFDLVMLYRSSLDIESKSYLHRSADFAWQTFWACGVIMIATIPLYPVYTFFHPFLLCIVYLYASLAPPGAMTSILGLITIPVKVYPYIIIGLETISGGPYAGALAIAGCAVGHLWWWSVWGGELAGQGRLSQYSIAPTWVSEWYGEGSRPAGRDAPDAGGQAAGLAQAGIHVTRPRVPLGAGGTPQTTQHAWGTGRRLG